MPASATCASDRALEAFSLNGEVEAFRLQLEAVDEQILDLIAQRLSLASRLGEVKGRLGLPVRDSNRKDEVISKWKSMARKRGISEKRAERLAQELISASEEAQLGPANAQPSDLLIVGKGRMGLLLGEWFERAGHRVTLMGEDELRSGSEGEPGRRLAAGRYGIVVMAVPPDALLSFNPEFPAGSLVMDIASSKRRVFPALEARSLREGFYYIGAHPLFNQVDAPFLERVVLIPSATGKEKLEDARRLWLSAGFVPVLSDLETHERAMSAVQVMTHFFMLSLRFSLNAYCEEIGIDEGTYQTRNLRRLDEVVRDFLSNWRAVSEIISENAYARDALDRAVEAVQFLRRIGVEGIEGILAQEGHRRQPPGEGEVVLCLLQVRGPLREEGDNSLAGSGGDLHRRRRRRRDSG